MGVGKTIKEASIYFCETCSESVSKEHLRIKEGFKGHVVIENRIKVIRWVV